ncbi:hypothetical protein M9H77_02535 [Catharanthus roseus]|uniref:Uncharacterized protein n=1 Tax=Catharanthus roseus TaxID=4058 RepID=A0ACC0C8K6_CATRO|nr:hypothetical protein M9H77_02535 [Catharanthus roseus]
MSGARMHTKRGRRGHIKTSSRGMVARGPASTPVGLGLLLSGPCHNQNFMSYCISRRNSGSIHDPTTKYQELKENAERLHIETG